MSVSPLDLLQWAKQQPSHSECDHRAVVSRAYYAAYHDCVQWHSALPAPGSLSPSFKGGGMHHELFDRLSNPGAGMDGPKKMHSRKRAYALRELHALRVNADYKLQEPAPDGIDAVQKAERIFSVC